MFIDRVPVLYDINWTINPGENWAVLGSSAGRVTLLRLLAGDEFAPAPGRGEIVRELPRQGGVVDRLEVLRKGVRLVSDRQQATYTYDITGEELVFSGIDNSVGVYREPSEKELAQVTDILASLHLEFLAKRTIRSCSTGEFRRLLLARALAGEPDLLLLDEPFSGLDAPSRNEFFALLNQLARQGVQMILVTHHKADIFPAITHAPARKRAYLRDLGARVEGRLEEKTHFRKVPPRRRPNTIGLPAQRKAPHAALPYGELFAGP